MANHSPFGAHRPEVVDLVGSEPVVVQLEDLVRRYPDVKHETLLLVRGGADTRRQAARLHQASSRLLVVLDGLPADLLNHLDAIGRSEESRCSIAAVRHTLGVLRDECAPAPTTIGGGLRQRRPPNWPRRMLESAVGMILAGAGVPLKKSRDGDLARVLEYVYEAAGERVPAELIRVLVRVVDEQRRRPARIRAQRRMRTIQLSPRVHSGVIE